MAEETHGELSAREREILAFVATGATNRRIAVELTISVNTVKAHLRNIFTKLDVESRTQATLYAIQHRLINVPQPPVAADESAPVILPPHRVRWPLRRGQRLALLCAIALVLTVAVWPIPQANSRPGENRLVDVPAESGSDIAFEARSRWHAKAQMPTPRGRFAQAEVNGIIYVISGLGDDGWSSRVEAYDPVNDSWDRLSSKPTAVANVDAAVVNGLIYVPGGLDETNAVRDVLEVYDPRADLWTMAAPLPVPLCAYAIAPFGPGFYLFGGWNGRDYLDSVYYYDVVSNTWREEERLRAARGFAAATTVEERIYLIGGYDGSDEYSLCESYQPALAAADQDPWRSHAPMRTARAGHSAVAFQGNVYVVGGGWDHAFTYNERYDLANNAWSSFESPMIGEWRTLGLSVIESGGDTFFYAIGGWNGRHLAVVQAYQASFRVYLP